jgi:hypothetical protein
MEERDRRRPSRSVVRRRQSVAATVLFTLTLVAVFTTLWPELPFPEPAGVLAVLAAGLLFGLMLARWWSPLLGACVLPAAMLSGGTLWAGVVALFVAGPAAALGLMAGALWSARRLGRRRRPRKEAERRSGARRRRRPGAALVEG